eukprot:1337470-Prorocentrum_lima.AAC.1
MRGRLKRMREERMVMWMLMTMEVKQLILLRPRILVKGKRRMRMRMKMLRPRILVKGRPRVTMRMKMK